MIIVSELKTTEHRDWETYVTGHPLATPYHRIGWALSIEEAYGHKSLNLIAKRGGVIVGLLPLIIFATPFKKALCSLPYCDLGDCIGDNEEIKKLLYQYAIDALESTPYKAMEIRKRTLSQVDFGEIKTADTLNETAKVSMLLDLPGNAETLWNGFKSKLRSQVRKAEKNELVVETGNSEGDISQFYSIFCQNMHRLGSPVHSRQWFQSLRKHYGDDLMVFQVKSDHQTIGAAIVLICGENAAVPWASTLSRFNHLSPNMLLYWALLKYVADRPCKMFDFGRSTPGEGTFKFKKQWGAIPVPLNWQVITQGNTAKDSSPTQSIAGHNKERLRSMVEKIWQRLPLNLTVALGPKIRKYISL